MSTLQGSGRLVTNGLVLYYDPYNPKSFTPGTRLLDLSSTAANASLINGVSYSISNFIFDGLDDYILLDFDSTISSIQVPMTIMGWFFDRGTTPRPTIFSQYLNASLGNLVKLVRAEAGTFSYYCSKDSSPNFQTFTFPGAYRTNTWNFFAVTVNGTLTASSIRLTVNQSSATFSATTMSTPNTSVQVRIGVAQSTFQQSQEFFSGNISMIQVYNRVLSTTEIDYTFQSTRARFL